MILAATDVGTALFGVACVVGGILVLAFRDRWHAYWWRGHAQLAPDDPEFERGVYRWGTLVVGAVLILTGASLAISGLAVH